MRTNQGNKVETYQNELKIPKRKRRAVSVVRGVHIRGSVRPASRKTGQPEWFQAMQWESKRKRMLVKLPVSELTVRMICSPKQASALREAGFITVWDVVIANRLALLAVPGFGPKTLAKLWQDAKIKGNLDMKWKPL